MLKAKLSNYYRSQKTGQPVFVYTVTGSEEELAAFKTAKGSFYREDENGVALHFSSRALSNNRNESISLTITNNNNIVADDLNKVLAQNEKLEDYILREQAKVMAAQALGRAGVRGLSDLTSNVNSEPTPEHVAEVVERFSVGADIPA